METKYIIYFLGTINFIEVLKQHTKKLKLTREYSLASLFTYKQLEQVLKDNTIIQDHKLILVSSHNHSTAIFKDGKDYYYYDPNQHSGEIQTSSLKNIAQFIFQANLYSFRLTLVHFLAFHLQMQF